MRLYLTPADFAETSLGTYWTAAASPLAVARALARASRAADTIIRGHLGMPGVTTAAASIAPGATIVSVTSVVNLAPNDVLTLDGAETVLIAGVTVTNWAPPYPGTVQLVGPTAGGYANGVPLIGMYRERWTARGASTNATEFAGPLTQEAQTARAHAPEQGYTDLVRTVFLGAAPVTQLISVAVVLRYGGTPIYLTLVNDALNPAQGWYRLPLGTYVPQGSDVETTYIGGYGTVPEDVEEAVGLLAADDLSYGNAVLAQGFVQVHAGDQAIMNVLRGDKADQSMLRSRAAALLQGYVRLV